MKRYCTTCGSIEFRKLCKIAISHDKIVTMINAVSEFELTEHIIEEWIDPMRIILFDFGNVFQKNCALIVAYEERERRFSETKLNRLRKEEEKQTDVQARKKLASEVKKLKQEEAKVRQTKEKECRDKILLTFNSMDINQKLLTIANDQKNLPHYYPINLMKIDDTELRALPATTLEIILEKFSIYEKLEWNKFHSRVLAILSQL